MQPRRLLTSSSPGQNLCRITAAYPANDLLRPLPPQGRGLFFSNYRDINGAVNVYGLCGFSTHWPGGHCQGTPSLTLTKQEEENNLRKAGSLLGKEVCAASQV